MMPKPVNQPIENERPTWYRLYYLLAVFDVFAVCVSLYLNHRIMRIYVDSVANNRAWVEILRDASELGELAANLDAPGNDVFQSRQIDAEHAKMDQAAKEFRSRLAAVRQTMAAQPPSEQMTSILDDLQLVGQMSSELVRSGHLVFTFLRADLPTEATSHMASMDRSYSTINSTLVRLRSRIGSLQNDLFATQMASASWLQSSEYLIAGIITLMILSAAGYGRIIAHQVGKATRRKELYRQELEQRVVERTTDLTAVNEARAQLLHQLITAQEDERRRIARDLHDGIGQSLTYLVVTMKSLPSTDPVSMSTRLSALRDVTIQTLDEVRRLARGMRPSVLDDLGLLPALERLVDDTAEAQGLQIELKAESLRAGRMSEALETALYRIIQESLTNICKYAAASRVELSIARHDHDVEATIADNGQGFSIAGSRSNKSLGLASIRERAAILGGVAEISSAPQQGTTIRVTIPLPEGSAGPSRSPALAVNQPLPHINDLN